MGLYRGSDFLDPLRGLGRAFSHEDVPKPKSM